MVKKGAETAANEIRLSVLDQSPVSEGMTGSEALRNSVSLAGHTEDLGYYRYWVAEHHGTPLLACASPEALIGAIASATHRIRVGSGGVMLPHYSPLKVAENFSLLSGLFPGRVDLGIGRAPGTDLPTSLALQRDRSQRRGDDFLDQLSELFNYLENNFPRGHPFARLAALPGLPESPVLWLLGSSQQSAVWAGELGIPYVVADFISPFSEELATLYRERFVPSARLVSPRIIVAASVICAQTDSEAIQLAASWRMAVTLYREGTLVPVPSVARAIGFLHDRGQSLETMPVGRRSIEGSPATVRRGVEALARGYGADEVMIVTITHDHDARRRSYQLIANEFELKASLQEGPASDELAIKSPRDRGEHTLV